MSDSLHDGLVVGGSVGNFVIVSKIGRGGMGEVYLAEHRAIRTRVAIKTLLPHTSASGDRVQRFFNEAIAVSRIKHAGIAKIFDVGFLPSGIAYLVMEHLDGETLSKRIRRSGRLSLGQLADIARQIASVLDATHQAGITHRDLKPDNVFLVPDVELESGERVKVLDFGIAKLSGVSLTNMSIGTMGTPDYMAPEQWHDSRMVDWHTDAYALGCLAFEMATGRVPFPAATIAEAYTKHLKKAPPTIRELVPELPEDLDVLVSRLLHKQPEGRPASMKTVMHAFAALGAGQPGALATTIAPLEPIRIRATVATGAGQPMPALASSTPIARHPAVSSWALFALLGSISLVLVAILATLVVLLEEHDDITSPEAFAAIRVPSTSMPPTPPSPAPPTKPAELATCLAPPPPPPVVATPQPVPSPVSRIGTRAHRASARVAPLRAEPHPIDPYSAQPEIVTATAVHASPTVSKAIETADEGAAPRSDLVEKLDGATVAVGLSTVRSRILVCRSRSSAFGTVRVRVGVDMFDHVAGVSVVEATDSEVGRCVASALRGAIFPNTETGGWFTNTFTFD